MLRALLLFFLFSTQISAQLSIEVNKPDAIYALNENIQFNVSGGNAGTADYTIYTYRFLPPIATGTITLDEQGNGTILYAYNQATVLYCNVFQQGQKDIASAAVAPFDIPLIGQIPSDADAYWQEQRALIENMALEPQLTFYRQHAYSSTYQFQLNNINNRKVFGYITVPNTEGPWPAILTFPAFGNTANISVPEYALAERVGALSVSINIHNVPSNQLDPLAYTPNNSAYRDSIYYRNAILGAMQVIRYLDTRSDFNGTVAVTGVSQGAGLSFLFAGIEERVSLLAESNAALCQHQGIYASMASGFPNYIINSRFERGTTQHEELTREAIKYYDAAYYARHIDFPTYHVLSLQDTVTPPATVLAAYNQIRAPKILMVARDLGHIHPSEFIIRRYEYFKNYLPQPLRPSWPFPDNLTGYEVNSTLESIDQDALLLTAQLTLHGTEINNLEYRWEQIEGPAVSSLNPTANSYQARAILNQNGNYLFRLTIIDPYNEEMGKRYYIQDYLHYENYQINSEDETPTASLIQLTPNPVHDQLNIDFQDLKIVAVDVYDARGEKLLSKKNLTSSSSLLLPTNTLVPGIYFLSCLDAAGQQRIEKFIKL